MGKQTGSRPSYDDLLGIFKVALDRALSGVVLPTPFSALDLDITLALLDVSYAARQRRPTDALVRRACMEFAAYAVSQDAAPPDAPPIDLTLAT